MVSHFIRIVSSVCPKSRNFVPMKPAAVMMFRDEADILGRCLDHWQTAGIDKFFLCDNGCKDASAASAEEPRRNATARAWRIFKEQVVFAQPVGFWQHYGESWWAKNK